VEPREQALIDTDPDRVPPLALPPLPTGRDPRRHADRRRLRPGRPRGRPHRARRGRTAATTTSRTSPAAAGSSTRSRRGREALRGDLHFSQGDGEITFCGAIEMGGFIDLHVDLIKGGMETYGVTDQPDLHARATSSRATRVPGLHRGLGRPRRRAALPRRAPAYQRACLNAIDYLKKFGYSGEQAYLLLGSAPIEGRLSGVVDIPNACCSLYLPTAIFDFDIRLPGTLRHIPCSSRTVK
jgi:formamidase